ncbi:MAG: sulfurtransferase TusA family protein [Clostridiales Family XIII bacterium]|nr:sulfurtransferase TusA family protein [Clostridiales Family XIII bacterium]
MAEKAITKSEDITDVVCPITFVKAKVAIEGLSPGELLELRINEGEAMQNVPRSLKEEGHRVTSAKDNEDGTYTVVVEKDGLRGKE